MPPKSKWIMKQYWRLTTVRAILGVLLGMLVLGRYYYGFLPILRDMDPSILGAIVLAAVFLGIFLVFGFIYDDVLQLWNERSQVNMDKNPYSYVPLIRLKMAEYPYYYSWLYLLRCVATDRGLDAKWVSDLALYLDEYYRRSPERRSDLFQALKKGEVFLENHPFVAERVPDSRRQPIGSKVKKWFMLQVWRLTWVQNFTGVLQDSLVFAALYVGILFGVSTETGTVPIGYLILGVLVISVPFMVIQVAAGWYYDRRLQLWSPDQIVRVERNPYSYVPEPRLVAFGAPFLYAQIHALRELAQAYGVSTSQIHRVSVHLERFFNLAAEGERGIEKAKRLRKEFGSVFIGPNTESALGEM
ncbi:MAG: hypothetical protein ACTSPE_03120 [Candidatus Thorarchaeota archaeon]